VTALPLLWLYGPPGVGKTTVAWELFERLCRRLAVGYVDIDQLGMCYAPPTSTDWSPEPADDPGRHRLKARALAAVAANFRDAGAQCLIVPGVTDPSGGIEPVPGTELTTCRLRAVPADLARRITGRGGATDIAEALEHAEVVDRAAGPSVDTTGLTVAEVADRVLERTGWPTPAEPCPRPLRRFADPGEILLLCGPAAVGKSTVGWQVYQRLRRTGRNAAFADLGQLSFHRPELGHGLRAANLSAVWHTFRAAGAECLVAVGLLDRPEDLAAYPATITVCCLDASEDVLLDRATRRARGETSAPGLAGDTLLGQSPEQLRTIANRAARTVDALRDVGDLHVNTDLLSPEEIATVVTKGLAGSSRW
jgi:RNA helicase